MAIRVSLIEYQDVLVDSDLMPPSKNSGLPEDERLCRVENPRLNCKLESPQEEELAFPNQPVTLKGKLNSALWKVLDGARYRYSLAVVLVSAAVTLRLTLLQSLGIHAVFVTIYPAVILAALYGGIGPGMLATLLSAAFADYLFFENHSSAAAS